MSKSILQIIVELFCAKNRSKKLQILEKWEHFQNRQWLKVYRPCKILNLGQKLKLQKTCQNPFYKSFRVVLCKNPLEKSPNIREMRPFWKSTIMQRLKPMQNPHFGSKIKIPKKHVKIHSPNHLELFCAKNRSKKHQIFEKWDHF